MADVFPDLPGWRFKVEEVSAGVYAMVGSHADGRRVRMRGTDPDTLLDEARRHALTLDHTAE